MKPPESRSYCGLQHREFTSLNNSKRLALGDILPEESIKGPNASHLQEWWWWQIYAKVQNWKCRTAQSLHSISTMWEEETNINVRSGSGPSWDPGRVCVCVVLQSLLCLVTLLPSLLTQYLLARSCWTAPYWFKLPSWAHALTALIQWIIS